MCVLANTGKTEHALNALKVKDVNYKAGNGGSMSIETYNAAVNYQKIGLINHPLSPPNDKSNSPGKRPLIKDWQNINIPTEDQLKEWFLITNNNIGLQCGTKSNVMVLDFDHEMFRNEVFNGIELNTKISGRTAGRGHVYFKFHPMLLSQKHHDLGIEILSNGSNAVMPPSIHASGDVYKWTNPDAPIMDMPETVVKNLNKLFRTEAELKQIIAKCRHCFRDVIKRKPDMHGADGREYMIAVCTDIKAVRDDIGGQLATEDHIKMFAKLMYGKDYNEARTLQEWKNIDASKTWKCDTLKAKLPAYAHCDKCEERKKEKKQRIKNTESGVLNGAFGYIDRIVEKTPLYYDTSKCFWLWDYERRLYNRVDETTILLTLLREIADPSIIENTFKKELLEAARLRGRDAEVKPVPDEWLYVENCVINVTTGETFEPTPEHLFTAPIPHKLSNSEDTPTIDKLFESWVSKDKIPLLYEIVAYCLHNGYPIHRMFILVGRGRNGKGQFRDLIVKLVGTQNRTASTLEQLINSRFESARLEHKKICTMGEINYTLLDRTAILKMLSGGDPIPAERKNKEPYEFVNTAKLIINTNSVPQTADKTDAWYSRCVAIEFPNQFQKGKDIIDTIPEAEYDNLLTKCIRILRELLLNGEFTNEGDIQAKEKEYERLSNPLKLFIDTHCEFNPDYIEGTWRMLDHYVVFCSENGFKKPSSKNEFNDMLRVNYEIEKDKKKDYKTGKFENWVWVIGMRLKNDVGYPQTKTENDKPESGGEDFPNFPNFPKDSLSSLHGESYENLGKTGKTGKNESGQFTESIPQMSYNSSAVLGKKGTTDLLDFGVRAKDWIALHDGEPITNQNKVAVSMWIAETTKHNPSEVMRYLEKEYKLTPEV